MCDMNLFGDSAGHKVIILYDGYTNFLKSRSQKNFYIRRVVYLKLVPYWGQAIFKHNRTKFTKFSHPDALAP
jgi:hypothetical protein